MTVSEVVRDVSVSAPISDRLSVRVVESRSFCFTFHPGEGSTRKGSPGEIHCPCSGGRGRVWSPDCPSVPSSRCRAALSILAASIAAAASSSLGVPDPGMMRTARCANRSGGASFPTRASSTAEASPPSGRWSSAMTNRPPVSRTASISVSRSIGLMEYTSMTRAAIPLRRSDLGRCQALVNRDAGTDERDLVVVAAIAVCASRRR